jgi:hypothetical protein
MTAVVHRTVQSAYILAYISRLDLGPACHAVPAVGGMLCPEQRMSAIENILRRAADAGKREPGVVGVPAPTMRDRQRHRRQWRPSSVCNALIQEWAAAPAIGLDEEVNRLPLECVQAHEKGPPRLHQSRSRTCAQSDMVFRSG